MMMKMKKLTTHTKLIFVKYSPSNYKKVHTKFIFKTDNNKKMHSFDEILDIFSQSVTGPNAFTQIPYTLLNLYY